MPKGRRSLSIQPLTTRRKIGLMTHAQMPFYDLIIVGVGMASFIVTLINHLNQYRSSIFRIAAKYQLRY
jgi:hypothetical protein